MSILNPNNTNQSQGLNSGILASPSGTLQRQTLKDLLYTKKPRIVSLDIEGTGVVGPRTNITQVGVHSGYFGKTNFLHDDRMEHTIVGAVQTRYRTLQDVPVADRQDVLAAANALGISPEQYLSIPTEDDYIRAHAVTGAEEFGIQQAQRGSFNSMIEDHRKKAMGLQNSVLTLTESLDQIEELLTRDQRDPDPRNRSGSVLLIQNTDYENKMFQSKQGIANQYGQALTFKRMQDFNQNVRGVHSANNIFSDTPFDRRYVQPMRDLAKQAKSAYNSAKSQPEIDKILTELQVKTTEFQNAVIKKTGDLIGEGKTVVYDLMDFTFALQNRLANPLIRDMLEQQNLKVTAPMLMRNRGIELLAETLLGEKEMHTALSDASQQNTLFYKVLQMTQDVEDGVLSDDVIAYVKAMNDPNNYNKDFLKTAKSQLSDINLKAQEMAQNGATVQEITDFISNSVPQRLSNVLSFYEGTPVNDYDRAIVLDQINKFITNPHETVNPLEPQTPAPNTTGSAIQSTPKSSTAQAAQNIVTQNIPNPPQPFQTSHQKLHQVIQSITKQQNGINGITNNLTHPSVVSNTAAKNLIQNIPNKTGIPTVAKIGLAGLGTMAFLNMLASSNDKKRDDETLFKNDTYDALYGNLYVGQGYADWKERSNSHKMIY